MASDAIFSPPIMNNICKRYVIADVRAYAFMKMYIKRATLFLKVYTYVRAIIFGVMDISTILRRERSLLLTKEEEEVIAGLAAAQTL